MSRRDRTLIARCDQTMDEFLEDYVSRNSLSSKSDAIRHIIEERMENEGQGRFGEFGMHVPMDVSTYEDVNLVLAKSGGDLKTVFQRAFSLWKKDILHEEELTKLVLQRLGDRSDRVYDTKERAQKGGSAKSA